MHAREFGIAPTSVIGELSAKSLERFFGSDGHQGETSESSRFIGFVKWFHDSCGGRSTRLRRYLSIMNAADAVPWLHWLPSRVAASPCVRDGEHAPAPCPLPIPQPVALGCRAWLVC